MKKIKVLYAEDERIVGKAIVNNLRDYESFEVGDLLTGNILSEYTDLAKVLVAEKPDVLLLDMELNYVPDGGLRVLKAIKKRTELDQMKVIIVSTRYKESEKELIKESLNSGVSGFIGKNADWEKLVSAIHIANQGQKNIFSQSIIDILASSINEEITENQDPNLADQNIPFEFTTLTKREKEVFALICQGVERSQRLITLGIVVKTYDHYWSNIKNKLDVKNEVQCLLYALEHGIDVGLKNWD